MATSPGALGGLRGLVFLRLMLSNIGVTVLPGQQALPYAGKMFNADDSLNDEQIEQQVMGLGEALTRTLMKK